MSVGIIGVGQIGAAVAANVAPTGTRVTVASRTPERADQLAAQLGDGVRAASIEDTIKDNAIVVLAVPYPELEKLITAHQDLLAGKIVVDPSNPITPDESGELVRLVPDNETAAQHVASWLPAAAHHVKTFSTLGAEALRDNAHSEPPVALFLAADSAEAADGVADLVRKMGYDPISVGGLDQAKRIEANAAGDLHQFAGLNGRLINGDEARSLV